MFAKAAESTERSVLCLTSTVFGNIRVLQETLERFITALISRVRFLVLRRLWRSLLLPL